MMWDSIFGGVVTFELKGKQDFEYWRGWRVYILCRIENNIIIDQQEKDRKVELGGGGEDLKQMLGGVKEEDARGMR